MLGSNINKYGAWGKYVYSTTSTPATLTFLTAEEQDFLMDFTFSKMDSTYWYVAMSANSSYNPSLISVMELDTGEKYDLTMPESDGYTKVSINIFVRDCLA